MKGEGGIPTFHLRPELFFKMEKSFIIPATHMWVRRNMWVCNVEYFSHFIFYYYTDEILECKMKGYCVENEGTFMKFLK